ncbi:hypothetical protein SEA_MOLLYMUR_57 [Gordonia phage Mollymur]|uniref:Uncharacterized protein n=1 Tax=Gordonia phage Mollymur TaxID=2590895 RepID=A0A4Y6EA08_9CAUD|nr:hypothetical protein PQB84_gp068 [Gordonia phage Mollymur]QDF15418.1 hypothetical protein SEA_MOLLYMUR_57 [Gordonia phage Mollymur]
MDDEATLADIGRNLLRKPIAGAEMTAPTDHDKSWGALAKDPTAIWALPADAYECTNGPVRVDGGVEIESWGGLRPRLADKYQSGHVALRDFRAFAPCPHCGEWQCHWIELIPVPESRRQEWGAEEVLARRCRSCSLTWRETP